MRTVIQRVAHASVTIEGICKSKIGKGYLVLLGIGFISFKKDTTIVTNLDSKNIELRKSLFGGRND